MIAKATVTIKAGRIPIVIIDPVSGKVNPDRKLSMQAAVVAQNLVSLQWSTLTNKAGDLCFHI